MELEKLFPTCCYVGVGIIVLLLTVAAIQGIINRLAARTRTGKIEKLASEGNADKLLRIALRKFDVTNAASTRSQLAAARALYEIGGREAITPIIETLNRRDARGLRAAAMLLAIEETRAQAKATLANHRSLEKVKAYLLIALKDPDEGMRIAAVEAVGPIAQRAEIRATRGGPGGGFTGVSSVWGALRDESPDMRAVAFATLKQYPCLCESAPEDVLKSILEEPDADICIETINALGELFWSLGFTRRERVAKALSDATGHPDRNVAEAVAHALAKIDSAISCWTCGRESGKMMAVSYHYETFTGSYKTRHEGGLVRPVPNYDVGELVTVYICAECFNAEGQSGDGEHTALKRLIVKKMDETRPTPRIELDVTIPGLWPFPDGKVTLTDSCWFIQVDEPRDIGGSIKTGEHQ